MSLHFRTIENHPFAKVMRADFQNGCFAMRVDVPARSKIGQVTVRAKEEFIGADWVIPQAQKMFMLKLAEKREENLPGGDKRSGGVAFMKQTRGFGVLWFRDEAELTKIMDQIYDESIKA